MIVLKFVTQKTTPQRNDLTELMVFECVKIQNKVKGEEEEDGFEEEEDGLEEEEENKKKKR